MDARKPLTITTSTHPGVIALYLGSAMLGFLNATDLQTPQAMIDMTSEVFAQTWATCCIVFGTVALVGAWYNPRRTNPVDFLWMEFMGCVGIFATQAVYEWTLATSFGLSTLQTQGYATITAVAAFARAVQCVFEIRKSKKAQRHPELTVPMLLADPDDKTE